MGSNATHESLGVLAATCDCLMLVPNIRYELEVVPCLYPLGKV